MFISPILDAIASVIITSLEVIKGFMAIKVSKYNYYISNIGDEKKMNTIGFVAPTEEDDNQND